MITLLLVGPPGETPFAAPPSVELIRCANPDDALETLSRNRRIDAVLFLDGVTAQETAALLAEEGASWPPMFQAGSTSVPGRVSPLDPASILDDLRARLGE